MTADERHKAAAVQTLDHGSSVLLRHQLQFLGLRWTYRNYHTRALAQLLKKRCGNLRRGSGDHNCVERRHVRQSVAAIADDDAHIVVSQPGQRGLCIAGERRVSFY